MSCDLAKVGQADSWGVSEERNAYRTGGLLRPW